MYNESFTKDGEPVDIGKQNKEVAKSDLRVGERRKGGERKFNGRWWFSHQLPEMNTSPDCRTSQRRAILSKPERDMLLSSPTMDHSDCAVWEPKVSVVDRLLEAVAFQLCISPSDRKRWLRAEFEKIVGEG